MKSLKEFIEENEVTGFELIPNKVILNVIVGEKVYGIDIDTSKIESGIQLETVNEYEIKDNILIVGNITLDTNNTLML
jgi:hypothetical protein